MYSTLLDYLARMKTGVRNTSYGEVLYANRFAYLMLLPTLLFLVLLLWIPFLRGIWISFHEWPLVGETTWVGLENYTYMFSWSGFHTSLKVTALYLLTVLIQLGIALVGALLVSGMDRFRGLVDGMLILPYTFPPVVSGTIWLYILDPDLGPLFQFLVDSGFIADPVYWQSDGVAGLAAIIFATSWQFWPFMYLIFLPTLDSIPEEHYEAAELYGAGRIQRFLRVTLPQLKTAILVAVTIRIVWNLAKVSLPYQMTQGGPGYDTSILGVLMYRFVNNRGSLGDAYVVGLVLAVVSFLVVALMIREFERSRRDTA